MASNEGYKLLEETDDSPEMSISIAGSWSESVFEEDNPLWLTESCSAVLEPSKDGSRDSDLLDEFFTLSYPEVLIRELTRPSNCESTYHEKEQQNSTEHHRTNNEQQYAGVHHINNNEQQYAGMHHSSSEQESCNERHNKDKKQSRSEHHNNSDQQSRSESHINSEQRCADEHCNSSEQRSSSKRLNREEPSNDKRHKNSEQQSCKEHQNSNNEQQTTGEHHNSDKEQSRERHNSAEQHSSSEHRESNEEQTDEPHANCCATFLDCYNVNSRKIRDSWFIYIFQLFASLLSASEIVVGIIFYESCDSYPSLIPITAVLMGISGIAVVYMWLAKVCRQRRGEYHWNLERNVLSAFLAIFLFLLTLEIAFFSQASPKTMQSKVEVGCMKAYYDYLYYMFFAIGGSLVLAASLYLPDCCIQTFTYRPSVSSHANEHYQLL